MVKNIINVKNLSKSFDVSTKDPGLKGQLNIFLKDKQKV